MGGRSAQPWSWIAPALIVGLVGLEGCRGETKPPEPGKPLLQVSNPHVNVGVFRAGVDRKMVEHTYTVTVCAETAVRVTAVETSCGCLAAVTDMVGKDLPPRSSHVVLLRMDASNRAGVRTEFARIVTEPPSPKPVVITLSAAIVAPPVVYPNPLVITVPPGTARVKAKVFASQLREKSSAALSLDRHKSSLGPFTIVDIGTSTGSSGKLGTDENSLVRDDLAVTLVAADAFPIGEHNYRLRLAWENADAVSTLPLKVRVPHPVRVAIDRVFVGEFAPRERFSATVPVIRASANAPRPSSIKCNLDSVEVRLNETADTLVITGLAPALAGRFEGAVSLSFQGGAFPPIQLAVSGVVR